MGPSSLSPKDLKNQHHRAFSDTETEVPSVFDHIDDGGSRLLSRESPHYHQSILARAWSVVSEKFSNAKICVQSAVSSAADRISTTRHRDRDSDRDGDRDGDRARIPSFSELITMADNRTSSSHSELLAGSKTLFFAAGGSAAVLAMRGVDSLVMSNLPGCVRAFILGAIMLGCGLRGAKCEIRRHTHTAHAHTPSATAPSSSSIIRPKGGRTCLTIFSTTCVLMCVEACLAGVVAIIMIFQAKSYVINPNDDDLFPDGRRRFYKTNRVVMIQSAQFLLQVASAIFWGLSAFSGLKLSRLFRLETVNAQTTNAARQQAVVAIQEETETARGGGGGGGNEHHGWAASFPAFDDDTLHRYYNAGDRDRDMGRLNQSVESLSTVAETANEGGGSGGLK